MKFKIILIGLFLVLLSIFIIFHKKIENYIDIDVCLDTGYCKQGLTLKINGIEQEINKTNCENNNGKWLENKGYCKFKN